MRQRRRNERRIATQRIRRLFLLAIEASDESPEASDRYVSIARNIGMKYNVRIPREFRKLICRRCKRFIFPGSTSRIRLRSRREPHLAITCLRCGWRMRAPIRSERSS